MEVYYACFYKFCTTVINIAYIIYFKPQLFSQTAFKEEEAECLRLMAEGDEEAKNKLIEHNLRLVAHVAKNIRRQQRAPATAKTYCP